MLATVSHADLGTLFDVIALVAIVLALFAFFRGMIEAGVGLLLFAIVVFVVFG
jgi:hypothetical protein